MHSHSSNANVCQLDLSWQQWTIHLLCPFKNMQMILQYSFGLTNEADRSGGYRQLNLSVNIHYEQELEGLIKADHMVYELETTKLLVC
jgi:hypothetical protein